MKFFKIFLVANLIWLTVPADCSEWTTPLPLSDSYRMFTDHPSADFDANGRIHVVYRDWVDSTFHVYYRNNAEGAWSDRVRINTPGVAKPAVMSLNITPDQVMHLIFHGDKDGKTRVFEMTKPVTGGSWSSPVEVSGPDGGLHQWSAVDASGGIYMFYLVIWFNPDRGTIYGRYKPLGGTWGPHELIRSTSSEKWPSDGYVTALGDKFYITYSWDRRLRFKIRNPDGSFSEERFIGSGPGFAPRIAARPNGWLDAAWHVDWNNWVSTSSDDGLTWSTPVRLNQGNTPLARNPQIAHDSNGNLHTVWQDLPGSGSHTFYRARIGGVWQSEIRMTQGWNIGNSYPGIDAINILGNDVHLFYLADYKPDDFYTLIYQMKPGISPDPPDPPHFFAEAGETLAVLSWTNPDSPYYLATMVRMSTAGFPQGPYDGTMVCLRTALPSSKDSFIQYPLSAGVTYYFSAFAQDSIGQWSTAVHAIATPDANVTPPADVSSFSVITPASPGTLLLSWQNPDDIDFKGTVIRYSTESYPLHPADGFLACNKLATPGSPDSFEHTGLSAGVTYYYTAFAYDVETNFAGGVHQSASAINPTCGFVKRLPDNTQIQLDNKVVTAVFPSDFCIYVQEHDRSSGIRVLHSGSGLTVGNFVNISGRVTTRMLSGYPAERQISNSTVIKTSSGSVLQPVIMNGLAVGGATDPPFVPGVDSGKGLNNMGLLVTVPGRITLKLGSFIYIDDGSGVKDILDRVGIMVRCPSSTIPHDVGDMVSVTGIVEGSIPSGWTENRRLVRMRDWDDIQLHQ